MARTRIHHEGKKNEIIGIAINQFMLRGYEQTTIHNIMEAANISKGALYHYFSSKDEILDAVMDYLMENETNRLQSLIADPALAAGEKLTMLITGAEQKPEETQQALENYRKTKNSVFRYRLQEESLLSTAKLFSSVISEGVANGEFHIANTSAVTSEFIAGALQTMLTATEAETGDVNDLENRVDMFIRLVEWSLGVENNTFSGIGKSLYRQILVYRGVRR